MGEMDLECSLDEWNACKYNHIVSMKGYNIDDFDLYTRKIAFLYYVEL